MTNSSSNIKDGFYCNDCSAYVESECICDRIVGYNEVTDCPIVDVTEEEEAYLHNKSISRVCEAGSLQNQLPEGNDMLLRDIDFVCELGDSKMGEIMRFELSDGYDIPLYEIDRLINLRRAVN
jgi:hypothetical protein